MNTPVDLATRVDTAMAKVADAAATTALVAVTGPVTATAFHGDPPPDARSGFEIGSVTKTFTGLLLAEMVGRGEVGYDDPITAYLPAGVLPRHEATHKITLAHLASHTSGLPRDAREVFISGRLTWNTNPYRFFRMKHLYRAATRIQPAFEPGTEYRYSNLGIGLLGQLLANAAGTDYKTLLSHRICEPLELADTLPVTGPRCVVAYRRTRLGNRPMPAYKGDGLEAAGILRSTPHDLERYLRAMLDPDSTPLADAIRAVQQPRSRALGNEEVSVVWKKRLQQYYYQGSDTRGFKGFIGFAPSTGAGVALVAAGLTDPRAKLLVLEAGYNLLKKISTQVSAAPS